MSIRDRLEVHRKDVLALLEQVTATAKLHPGSELAGAISNIARAQMLLAEELDYLADEDEPATRRGDGAILAESDGATPAHGYRLR